MRTGPDDDSPGVERPGESRPGERRPGERGPGEPRPGGLRPTKATTLILSALLAAALAWTTMSRFFGYIPDVTWLAGVTLAALAVVEGIAARNTKARIEGRPRAGALNPLFIARLAVLAKASSLAGAIFAGAYGGVAAWALSERGVLNVANANLGPAVGGLVGGLALVAAALLLERACRVPEPPDDDDKNATAGPTAPPRR